MKYLLNGLDITYSQFTSNGIQYPSSWAQAVSQQERDALGIITMTEIYPTITNLQKYSGTFTDVTTGLLTTRTYTVVAKTTAEISAYLGGIISSADALILKNLITTRQLTAVFVLSTDIKPTGTTGQSLYETDTFKKYSWISGAWVLS